MSRRKETREMEWGRKRQCDGRGGERVVRRRRRRSRTLPLLVELDVLEVLGKDGEAGDLAGANDRGRRDDDLGTANELKRKSERGRKGEGRRRRRRKERRRDGRGGRSTPPSPPPLQRRSRPNNLHSNS